MLISIHLSLIYGYLTLAGYITILYIIYHYWPLHEFLDSNANIHLLDTICTLSKTSRRVL